MKIDDVYKKLTVVHCATEEEANRILRLAASKGWKWNGGQLFTDKNNWNDYEGNTCYSLSTGTYADKEFYKYLGYSIIESTDIEGDVVYTTEGEKRTSEEKRIPREEIALTILQSLLSTNVNVKLSDILFKAKFLIEASFAIADEFLKYEKKNEKSI